MTAEAVPSADADITLATFERGPSERLAIVWREYQGFHFVDVRVQFFAEDQTWRPTRKGVTVKMRELFGVVDALAKAVKLAEQVRR